MMLENEKRQPCTHRKTQPVATRGAEHCKSGKIIFIGKSYQYLKDFCFCPPTSPFPQPLRTWAWHCSWNLDGRERMEMILGITIQNELCLLRATSIPRPQNLSKPQAAS